MACGGVQWDAQGPLGVTPASDPEKMEWYPSGVTATARAITYLLPACEAGARPLSFPTGGAINGGLTISMMYAPHDGDGNTGLPKEMAVAWPIMHHEEKL